MTRLLFLIVVLLVAAALGFAALNSDLVIQVHEVDLGLARYRVMLLPVVGLVAVGVIVVFGTVASLQVAALKRRLRRLEQAQPPRSLGGEGPRGL
jgi:hypothetical protein